MSTKCHISLNPRKNARIYHGDDMPGCVPLRYTNTWSQPYCRIRSDCPPSEVATNMMPNGVTASHVCSQAWWQPTGRRDMYEVRRDGSRHDGVTRMKSGVMAADVTA